MRRPTRSFGARSAKKLATAPYSQFVRLTPEQNVKLGLSPTARHYSLKGATRITKTTPTISARQYETKKARELLGLSPEQAADARRHGAISYVSADQKERVAKAALTREETKVVAEIKKFRASGRQVPSYSPDKRRHGRFHPLTSDARAPLPRDPSPEARRRAHSRWRMALVHRLCPSFQGPPLRALTGLAWRVRL